MKDGVRARTIGPQLHGTGLKKKYRSYPDDTAFKGKATKGKK